MSANQTYNGWTNYETWNIKLWMDNDSGSCDYWQDTAKEILEQNDCDKGAAVSDLADAIEQWHDEMQAETQMPTFGPFVDLLNAALSSVNWREIAENILSDFTVYAAGWNMPGYMPESDPALFLDADDALEYIKDAAKESAEIESDGMGWSDEDYETATGEIDAWKADRDGEFDQTFGKFQYFVQQA